MEVEISADNQVRLYIYDLAKGLAKLFAQPPLGDKRINGLWHTSVVVFGQEYYYGKVGISSAKPSGTILGNPLEILQLGPTQFAHSLFTEFLTGLGETKYTASAFHLFDHNSNNFTQEVITYLTGKKIPEYLLIKPKEIVNTPLGESLKSLLEPVNLNSDVKTLPPQAEKPIIKRNEDIEPSCCFCDTTSTTATASSTGANPLKERSVADSNKMVTATVEMPKGEMQEKVEQSVEVTYWWELNESLIAAKRRQNEPLVINNIDDSKYPQLLCFFKRPDKDDA